MFERDNVGGQVTSEDKMVFLPLTLATALMFGTSLHITPQVSLVFCPVGTSFHTVF
jgi:hypothetical protein